MKIVALTAENVKKLTVVQIRPDGNLVQITGRNGQGKSSVLDSIWWALAGTKHIQASPIRKGATKALIRLDLGEIVVTRTFRRQEGDEYTTTITVENAEGARFPSPQRMIDALLGELTFDPLAFSRMTPAEQFNALRRFVPDVDFVEIENANRGDYGRRTDINRQAKEKRAAAAMIQLPAGAPTDRRDESALVDELQRAGEHNAGIETRKARRESVAADVAKARAAAQHYRDRAADLRQQAEDMERQAGAARAGADDMQKKIDEAPPLPEPMDVAEIRARIASARDHNELVDRANERARLESEAQQLEAQSMDLTEAIAAREAAKRAAIAKAKLPVEGVTFGDGAILMNDVPFDQASDAEKLRASIAIAMASNPKLRVIRVRDGSLLDEDSMALLAEMATDTDYQVWIERVDSTGKVGFVLEDGHLKGAADTATVPTTEGDGA
jgi:hypothetical protein